jgi:hypothetical protein
VSLRSTFIAAEIDYEQDEAYSMLWDFKRKTGWQIDPLMTMLKKTWGRSNDTFEDEAYGQPQVETHHVLPEPEQRLSSGQSSVTLDHPHPHNHHDLAVGHPVTLADQQSMQSYSTAYYHHDFQNHIPHEATSDIQSQLMAQQHQHMMAAVIPTSRQHMNDFQDVQYQNPSLYSAPPVDAHSYHHAFQQPVQTAAERYMNVPNIPTSGPTNSSHFPY